MVGFDSIVFGMTLYKSIVLPRPNRVGIVDILFRDGELSLSGYSGYIFSPDEYLRSNLLRVGFSLFSNVVFDQGARTG